MKYNTTFLTLLNLWIKNWTCFLELIIYRCSECIYGLRCEGFIWNKCLQGPQCGRVLLAIDRLLEDACLEKWPHPFATFLVFAVQDKVKFVTVNSFQQTKLWQWLFLDHDEYVSWLKFTIPMQSQHERLRMHLFIDLLCICRDVSYILLTFKKIQKISLIYIVHQGPVLWCCIPHRPVTQYCGTVKTTKL